MSIDEVIKIINTEHGTNYTLLYRYDTGEWGAYRITEPSNQPVVLKFVTDLHNTNITDPDLNLARAITDRLRSINYPAPKHLLTGTLGTEGLYWIMEELPGRPLWENPTVEQVKQMVALLELQRAQAVSSKQNWSDYAKATVFDGKFGYKVHLQNYSKETAELLDRMVNEVKGLEDLVLPDSDIVHGDFSYHHVMVKEGKITGIIDWQEAGCGDWAIDLTRLLYSLHDRPSLARPVLEKIKYEDARKIKLYTVSRAMEMIAWPIGSDRDRSKSINKAVSAINFVTEKL